MNDRYYSFFYIYTWFCMAAGLFGRGVAVERGQREGVVVVETYVFADGLDEKGRFLEVFEEGQLAAVKSAAQKGHVVDPFHGRGDSRDLFLE